jgi:hypothetical protein
VAAQTITHTGGITLTSDAAFRTWGSSINAAIAAVGWIQTADTGQVNWTTATNPTANTFTNYEVWRMADATQSTDPVFIRIAYTRNSANGPRMQIVCGTATDGAGTLTSAANTNVSVTSAWEVFDSQAPAATVLTHNSYVNGDTSSLVLLLSPLVNGLSTNGGLFHIERRRNTDGTPGIYGFMAQWLPGSGGSTNNAMHYQTVYTHNLFAQPGVATANGYCFTGGRNIAAGIDSAVRASVVPAFPVFTGAYPEMGAASKWMLGIFRNDVGLGQTFQVSHYGATQTFMSVGNTWLFNPTTTVSFSVSAMERLVPAVRID